MNKKTTPKTTPKVNRALYVVTVALLFVVAVIIAVMGSGKRAAPSPKVDDQPSVSTDDTNVTEKSPDTYRPQVDTAAPDTKKAPDTQSKAPDEKKEPVSLPAPTLTLPRKCFFKAAILAAVSSWEVFSL